MQTSWRRLARETVLRWQSTGPRPFNPPTHRTNLFQPHSHAHAIASNRQASITASLSQPVDSSPHAGISPVQSALAASQAIRIAVSAGNLADAFLVLNSVHRSRNQQAPLLSSTPLDALRLAAIPFSPNTPIRPVAHSLLHSLLREGHHDKAVRLSEQLMKQGILIHRKTLDYTFKAVALNCTEFLPTRPDIMKSNVFNTRLKSGIISHQGGSYALRLLNIARQSRQKRTSNMFKVLITLCVVNGEIIAGSLLFGLMVHDWNAQVAEKVLSPEVLVEESVPEAAKSKLRGSLHWDTPRPSEQLLKQLTKEIERNLKVQDDTTHGQRQSALQALTNLAALLDERVIPFKSIDPLLHVLVQAQGELGTVDVPDESSGRMRTRKASNYFRDVLLRLSEDLPNDSVGIPPAERRHVKKRSILPALDVPSYNCLLRFALFRERQPTLAQKIVEHMKLRWPTLKPSNETRDILRQGALLVKDKSLWEMSHSLVGVQSSPPPPFSLAGYASVLAEPQTPVDLARNISYLVSMGYAGMVIKYLDHIFPAYKHCRRLPMSDDLNGPTSHIPNLKEAAAVGPMLFTAVLKALITGGQLEHTETLWILAQRASAYSFRDPELAAWSLPVHGYTMMLKVYQRLIIQGSHYVHNGTGGEPVLRVKRSVRPAHGFNATEPARRRVFVGRTRGMEMYRACLRDEEHYMEDIAARPASGKFHKHHQAPVPDALFFNAALEVVGREKATAPRQQHETIEDAEAEYERAREFHRATGSLPHHVNEDLVEVARDMAARGIPVPPGYKQYVMAQGVPRIEEREGDWKGRSMYLTRARRTTLGNPKVPRALRKFVPDGQRDVLVGGVKRRMG